MGRPREHDERTREALLAAAERLVAEQGIGAIGVRSVAVRAGTTTRAVYAVFGSKEALVQALAERAFELLIQQVDAVPLSDDPGEDLVAGAVHGFRAFAVEHPDLLRLVFAAWSPGVPFSAQTEATRLAAYARLILRVQRARDADLLGAHPTHEVALLWDAMCSGLALREVCGLIEPSQAERIWTDALRALLAGLRDESTRPAAIEPDRLVVED
jgi:AcrR family transcriptional regulator